MSIYNFRQSVEDNATVPLYYENRIPEVQLTNEDLNEDLQKIVEEAMLDDAQEEKLQREFARQYHIITRDDRLEKIAEDIVAHFVNRGFQGKAMVVSIDKPTAVKTYDKVRKHWKLYIERLKNRIKDPDADTETLKALIRYMEETDMAVVVSSEQNEVEKFRKLGLQIKPHRERMFKEDLAGKFKNPDDPFRIVFVCAMWMTGFDVQPLSTIYLDKPMKNHTLMQTVARANRVFKNKNNGLIVDYIGIFRELQKALAIYGSGAGGGIKPGDSPIQPKAELVKELEKAMAEAETFLKERGVDVQAVVRAEKFQRIKLVNDAVDAVVTNDDLKTKYLLLATTVKKLFKAMLPDPEARIYTDRVAVIDVIAERIRSLIAETDITEVMGQVSELLDRSIAAQGYVITTPLEPYGEHAIDLSKIDFEALKKKFATDHKHTQAEILRGRINAKLTQMVRLNKTRIDFLEKFQSLIDEYNAGAINVEIFFNQLVEFAQKLNEEEKRGIAEQLSEEELALFDLLKKPDLTKKEAQQVKLASKDLLKTLKQEKLVLDWRKRQQTRAEVQWVIETMLDQLLPPTYTKDMYEDKCKAVYRHVYESYYGAGKSVYSGANA